MLDRIVKYGENCHGATTAAGATADCDGLLANLHAELDVARNVKLADIAKLGMMPKHDLGSCSMLVNEQLKNLPSTPPVSDEAARLGMTLLQALKRTPSTGIADIGAAMKIASAAIKAVDKLCASTTSRGSSIVEVSWQQLSGLYMAKYMKAHCSLVARFNNSSFSSTEVWTRKLVRAASTAHWQICTARLSDQQ
jgi:hypothetical protein